MPGIFQISGCSNFPIALPLHLSMHYLLHIDTSTDKGIVAVSGDGVLLAYRVNDASRNHAGTLNTLINEVLGDAGVSLPDLSAISACAGPGSYTGLRIGVATAKGLCYALDKPLLLENRLTLMAYHPFVQKVRSSEFVSLLKAREKEYFISIYNSNFDCTFAPRHVAETQLFEIFKKTENSFIITDVAEEIINSLPVNTLQIDNNVQINLASWVAFSFMSYNCNNMINLTTAEPFYLKQVYTHN